MITLKNPLATSEWIINLKEYPQVENSLPMTGLNVRNDSNIVAYVDLDGLKVGEVQRYSADPFQGRNYSLIRIYNPDGQDFAPDDLFIQALKGEVMGSQPFNPQWDMMFDDATRFATGTNTRFSLSDIKPLNTGKYFINLIGGVIVLKRLDIQAHATLLGTIAITFNEDDVLNIAVGIGVPPPPDTVLHKAIVADESFDYSESNAEIIGFTADFLISTEKSMPSDFTIVIGGSDVEKSFTLNPNEYFEKDPVLNEWRYDYEISFSSRTINSINYGFGLTNKHAGHNRHCDLQLKIDGVWTSVAAEVHLTVETIFYHDLLSTGWNLVTGFRTKQYSSAVDAPLRFRHVEIL